MSKTPRFIWITRSSSRSSRAASGASGRSGGAVMVIALLALVLLAALVFYIFNVGQHVAKRVETQNAADNAAISGGRWMARSFNAVAANNVEMARLIALAGVLDAVPLAIGHTLEDQTAILEALDRQKQPGFRYGDDDWVQRAIEDVVEPNMIRQVDYLTPLNNLFNESEYDIARMTFFKSNSGQRGELWQAIEALGDLNRATMENLATLTQHSAFRGAQISQREGGKAAGGLLLPWLPQVPVAEYAFDDFESAVAEGQLPAGRNDAQFNRGPFDVLFGQRRVGQTSNEIFSSLNEDRRHGGNSLGWNPPPRTRQFEQADVETYFTTGTYDQLISEVRRLAETDRRDLDGRVRSADRTFYYAPRPTIAIDPSSPLAPSLWGDRVEFAANVKINRLFPGTANNNQIIYDPEWITNYSAAEAIQDAGTPRIVYGLYLSMEFRRVKTSSVFPITYTDPELVSWGLKRSESNPLAPPLNGGAALPKISDHVWREELPESDDPGFNEGDEQYLIYQVWLGVNTGQEVTIRNPYNLDEEERNAMPGPIDFMVDEFAPDAEETQDALKLFGIAHQPKAASFWSEKFDDDRPDSTMVAVAQAQVFNNHSWDLWTAMWHAQLTPIERLDDWMETLEDPQGLEQMPWLDEEDVAAVTAYLQATKPLMDLMLENE